jgi:hypothetical protein
MQRDMAKPKKVKRRVGKERKQGDNLGATDSLCSCGLSPKEYWVESNKGEVGRIMCDAITGGRGLMAGELCYGCACAWDDLGWIIRARRL